MTKPKNNRIRTLALVLKTLSNETRLRILNLLNHDPMTWTQIREELKLNPKSLRDHLHNLRDKGLIQKGEVGFEITHVGKLLLEISLKEIISVIEPEE
jgi:predicted transcriptional regulator